MKAMKCDRCGKIYIEGDGGNVKSIVIHKVDWDGRSRGSSEYFDLCTSCLDELVDFLANKEEKEETSSFIQGTVDLLPPIEGISEKDLEYPTARKLFENAKEKVEHACCCNEKKSNIDVNLAKGILDEVLKADRVRPLDIRFGNKLFNHFDVKGENEDE